MIQMSVPLFTISVATYGVSPERTSNSMISQSSSSSSQAGIARVQHLIPRCRGLWDHKSGQRFEWLENGKAGCFRSLITKACVARLPENGPACGDFLQVQRVSYQPPGTQVTLLDKVSMSLPEKSLGLVYGPSGSGKTTLLQVLGGLATPTEGSIYLGKDGTDFTKKSSGPGSLSAHVGIVFQFPERYFLTDTIGEELLFGYSRQMQDFQSRHTLTLRLQSAVFAVGLQGFPLDMHPRKLSDGYKRRLALAVQLVRMPDVMLLDEPLAGLDWRARADVVKLLSTLKKEKILIVVSHDLRELATLVDKSWRMEMGGKLVEHPRWTWKAS